MQDKSTVVPCESKWLSNMKMGSLRHQKMSNLSTKFFSSFFYPRKVLPKIAIVFAPKFSVHSSPAINSSKVKTFF